MLTVKRIHAGRAAVDYYLNQTRRGLADYYLPDTSAEGADDAVRARLSAPGSSWWGGGTEALGLSGEVERGQFVPMYAKGVRPGGGYLGTKFRQPEEVDAARADALQAASEIVDPYERWMAKHEIRRKGGHASVAAWDCTFSPPKSVSLLWAAGDDRVQRQVWAAHTAAVDTGLAYLEEHAAYVRAGRNGVRVLDTSGLVVARINEWTSRDGDMHLHTHCLLLNRAQTVEDGKWRALDGRAVLSARTGAGALYNRTVEAELTRRLGVGWRDRSDGLRELDGVDDELIDAFSSRRRAITARVEELAAAYRAKYGIDPPPAVLNAMGQTAWSTTRQRKHVPDPADALEQWEATARRHGRQLAALPARVIGKTRPASAGHESADEIDTMLEVLAAGGRTTFSRHDLLRAALDVLPPGDDTAEVLEARAQDLVKVVVSRPELIGVSAPDLIDAPAELRRGDGTSVYEQPDRHRWALRATPDQEAWLLDVAIENAGHHIDPATIETAVAEHGLGDDQADAARQLLGSPRRVGLLVGPAGAGKTRTLRAVVDAWQQAGGPVLGLTVSQAAAQVLSAEAQVRAENTAKWLHETARGRWSLPHGALVLVDEASMVSTRTLVDLVERAPGRREGPVGRRPSPACRHPHRRRLRSARRPARRQPPDRDPPVRRALGRSRQPAAPPPRPGRAGRVRDAGTHPGGPQAEVETGLFDAWHADARTVDQDGERRSVLMIVSTNEQAAVLAERARRTLIEQGTVSEGPSVRLRDNVASVGDHIVTRRNDRRLRTSNRGWVVNGDIWTILETYRDGAVDARRLGDGATITLPADYLAERCHLGYATTAHRAQGMTVEVCHAAITHHTSHQALYVAATRGRDGNHLWIATDTERDVLRDADDLPAPEHVLSRILERRDPDRLSVHQAIQESLTAMSGLARLGQVFEDAARTATDQWLKDLLADRGLSDAVNDPEWSTLLTTARQTALAGHNLDTLIQDAIRMRPMDGAHSTAAVLHWRLGALADVSLPVRSRGPLASLPPTDGPAMEVASQAGDLMRERWRQIRAAPTATRDALPWAAELGPQPIEPEERSAWLTAATAVAAYRERFELPDYTALVGQRPSSSRPDAQAAGDHACLQADRYVARRLRPLTDKQLNELDARQRGVAAAIPRFDPEELAVARRTLEKPGANEWQAMKTLEDEARQHRDWRRAANEAAAIRRQVHLAQDRRRKPQALVR